MIGYIGYITRSLSRNRLRFQLVTIGYTVTYYWLQVTQLVTKFGPLVTGFKRPDLIGYRPPDPAAAPTLPPSVFSLINYTGTPAPHAADCGP